MRFVQRMFMGVAIPSSKQTLTAWGPSETHQRLVRYRFGDLNFLVRFESDGFHASYGESHLSISPGPQVKKPATPITTSIQEPKEAHLTTARCPTFSVVFCQRRWENARPTSPKVRSSVMNVSPSWWLTTWQFYVQWGWYFKVSLYRIKSPR